MTAQCLLNVCSTLPECQGIPWPAWPAPYSQRHAPPRTSPPCHSGAPPCPGCFLPKRGNVSMLTYTAMALVYAITESRGRAVCSPACYVATQCRRGIYIYIY